jgi:hypothetical protein
MAKFNDKTKEPQREELKKEVLSEETVKEWFPKEKEIVERKELTQREKEEREKLREEIEKAKLSPEEKINVQREAEKLKQESVKGRIKHLLDLAEYQGLTYAVKVAKEMKDPLTLDLFHDILAKNGLFKKFLK